MSVLAHTDADHESELFHRSLVEDRLALATMELARRNEALEDFASLVAHELKTPLLAALAADDPSSSIEEALDLVENLLEAARSEKVGAAVTSAADLLEQLTVNGVEVTSELSAWVPLPKEPLRVVLRNLLANAAAAGARHIHVTSARSAGTWQLFVDDDGSGLEETGRYASGSGIGFGLSGRIAARFGGTLELTPRPRGGTRAALVFDGAPR